MNKYNCRNVSMENPKGHLHLVDMLVYTISFRKTYASDSAQYSESKMKHELYCQNHI